MKLIQVMVPAAFVFEVTVRTDETTDEVLTRMKRQFFQDGEDCLAQIRVEGVTGGTVEFDSEAFDRAPRWISYEDKEGE